MKKNISQYKNFECYWNTTAQQWEAQEYQGGIYGFVTAEDYGTLLEKIDEVIKAQ